MNVSSRQETGRLKLASLPTGRDEERINQTLQSTHFTQTSPSLKIMSSSLIWQLTRKQNAFLKKQRHSGGAQFSSHPFNLTGKHCFVDSGLNTDAVKVTALSVSTKKFGTKTTTEKLKKKSGGVAGVEKACAGYRSDLSKKADARYKKLLKGRTAPVTENRVKKSRSNKL